ncbi:MAG: DinB family protein [bacterium]|nr:DinB family protein [bacterium]
MTTAELLADQLDGARAWTLGLVQDLDGDEWTFQPQPGLHHALWLCGHLATAEETLVFHRCLGEAGPVDPAFRAHFGIGQPVTSAGEHDFPPPAEVLATMADVHAKTLAAIRQMSDEFLNEPAFGPDGKTKHPHYDTKAGAVTHLARHEAFHAGQIALLRRLMGKPFLR